MYYERKNTMKKIICSILSLSLMMMMGLHVFATEDRTEYISPEQQLEGYLQNPDATEQQKQYALEHYKLGQQLASGENLPQTRVVIEGSNVLRVPFCSQNASYIPSDKQKYFCGPATTKQTLDWITKRNYNIFTVAQQLKTSPSGTGTNEIMNYLNQQTQKYYQVLWSWKDANALANMVINDISESKPIVAHVKISVNNQGSWPYRTNGHYLNYNGYTQYGKDIAVTDPFENGHHKASGKYVVSKEAAEAVTDRIVW